MSFRIGEKIICINASPRPSYGPTGLRENAVYTVRGFSDGYDDKEEIAIHLEEIVNPQRRRPDGSERGYWQHRFRPLISKSTDTGMSILRKLQDPANPKYIVDTTSPKV